MQRGNNTLYPDTVARRYVHVFRWRSQKGCGVAVRHAHHYVRNTRNACLLQNIQRLRRHEYTATSRVPVSNKPLRQTLLPQVPSA